MVLNNNTTWKHQRGKDVCCLRWALRLEGRGKCPKKGCDSIRFASHNYCRIKNSKYYHNIHWNIAKENICLCPNLDRWWVPKCKTLYKMMSTKLKCKYNSQQKSSKSFKQKATVIKGACRGKSKKKFFHFSSIQISFSLTNLTFSDLK